MSSSNGRFVTQDFAVAKYLHAFGKQHEIQIRSAKRIPGVARHEFAFDDPNGRAQTLLIEFVNSNCRPFDDAGQSLKTMLAINDNSGGGSPRRRRRGRRGSSQQRERR